MSKTIIRSLLLAIAGIFALGLRAQVEDPMFYIGETGYASWSDAYNTAQNGDMITVGANGTMAPAGGKTITIDLAGRELEWQNNGWWYGSLTVVDSIGTGQFKLYGFSRNVGGGTVDLTSLNGSQITDTGKFYTNGSTTLKFPDDMSFSDCTGRLANTPDGLTIIWRGITYTRDGSSWVFDAPTNDITITAPQNGTLETSVTNDVAAGTIVTVTATPAAGYELVSVTTNGAALAGTTFEMPFEAVTLAATFEEQAPHMFFIGATGYDSWADVYNAAKDGDTIMVGTNATMVVNNEGKTLTIDLAGRALEWAAGSWMYGTRTVIDTVGQGQFTLASGSRNVNGATVDLSSLTADQLAGTGTFWTGAATVVKFPSGMAFADCTPKIGNQSAAAAGQIIVVQGVTYTWNGTSWETEKKGMIIYVL